MIGFRFIAPLSMDISTARMLALLVVIMGIGLVANHGLGRVADWLAPWQRGLGAATQP